MNTQLLVGALAFLFATVWGGVFVYQYFFAGSKTDMRALMGSGSIGEDGVQSGQIRQRLNEDRSGQDYAALKNATKKGMKKKAEPITLEERFFRAGYFNEAEKAGWRRTKLLSLIISPIVIGCLSFYGMGTFDFFLIGLALGAGIGYQIPNSILDRRYIARSDEILFYLPLVIEQIAIGVSSSLDIGPCLEKVVSMADERDTHNVVTELIRHAQFYIRSGVSLDDAMNEVGKLSGHTELKQAFMSLAQVARHGGEISRQLNDLADAVGNQRNTKVEEKIKKLELEATGPVALVFVGFMIILLIGFGLQIQGAFG